MSDLGLGPPRALRRSQRIVLRKFRLKHTGRWPSGHDMKGCAYLLKCRSTQKCFWPKQPAAYAREEIAFFACAAGGSGRHASAAYLALKTRYIAKHVPFYHVSSVVRA